MCGWWAEILVHVRLDKWFPSISDTFFLSFYFGFFFEVDDILLWT